MANTTVNTTATTTATTSYTTTGGDRDNPSVILEEALFSRVIGPLEDTTAQSPTSPNHTLWHTHGNHTLWPTHGNYTLWHTHGNHTLWHTHGNHTLWHTHGNYTLWHTHGNHTLDGFLKNLTARDELSFAENVTDNGLYVIDTEEYVPYNDTEEYVPYNDTGEYVPYNQRPETYVVPLLFAIIFIVGVIGNGALIVIFVRNKNLRNVPNTYIISLALGDLLVLFFTVPFVSTIYTIESWPYGTFECKFSEFVRDISVGVTVFTLTALAADRYLAIVSPVRKAVGAGRGVTVRAAVSIWLVAVLLATPAAVLSHVRVFEVSEKKAISVCFPFPEHFPNWYEQATILTKALIYYLLPLIVIATFYLLMARHLFASNVPGESHVFHRQIRTRRKVAKVVLCFVLIFAICFLPTHVFLLWFYFDPQASIKYNEFWNALRIVGFCLGFINSCINPIALYCISGTFRKQYNRYLFCCCWGKVSRRNVDSLRSMRSNDSRYRCSTLRVSETINMTTLMQEKPCTAAS